METNQKNATDAQVRAVVQPRIDALATRKEKVFEAAKVLFFDFGIYPSVTAVYAFVQRGSKTDIAQDLREFWSEVRSKNRIDLDAPYLPEALVATYSQALSQIWDVALTRAEEQFEVHKSIVAQQVVAAQQQAEEAKIEAQNLVDALNDQRQKLLAEVQRREEAEIRAEGLARETALLSATITEQKQEVEVARQDALAAQKQFSEDLKQMREKWAKDNEAHQGEIRFAKMQIEAARQSEAQVRDRAKSDLAAKDLEVANYQKRLFELEQKHSKLIEEKTALHAQLKALQTKESLTLSATENAVLSKKQRLRPFRRKSNVNLGAKKPRY